MDSRQINVHITLGDETHPVGRLWCHFRKGRENASFEYDDRWLANPEPHAAHRTPKAAFSNESRIFDEFALSIDHAGRFALEIRQAFRYLRLPFVVGELWL